MNIEDFGFRETGEIRKPEDGEWFWSPQLSKPIQASSEVYLIFEYMILEKVD